MTTATKKPFFLPPEMQQEQEAAKVDAPPVSVPSTTEKEPASLPEPYLPLINLKTLPSQHIPYPKGVDISYHPYKFGELKKFAQSKLSIKQRYEFILDGIIVNGMEKTKLTFNDFLFIALMRKMSSIGVHEISISFKCGKCGHENQHHIMLDQLGFNEIKVPDLPARITVNNKELEFSPLTVADFFTLFKEGKEQDPVSVLAIQCRSHPMKEAYAILFEANPEDSELLEELNKIFFHGLETMKIPCTNKEAPETEVIDGVEVEKTVHCDFTNHIDLGDPGLIVQPFRGSGRTPKDRIQFGSRTPHESK